MLSANPDVQFRKVSSSDISLKKFIPGKMDEIIPDLIPTHPCGPQSQESQQTSVPPATPRSLTVCGLSLCNTCAWWVMKILYHRELGTYNANRQASKQENKRLLRGKGSKKMPDSS